MRYELQGDDIIQVTGTPYVVKKISNVAVEIQLENGIYKVGTADQTGRVVFQRLV
jgi:hypothetical protein